MFVMSPCEIEFENPQNLEVAAISVAVFLTAAISLLPFPPLFSQGMSSKNAQNSRLILSSSKCFIGIRSFAGNADSYSALTCGNQGASFVTSKNWSMGDTFYERIVWLRSIVKALCEIRRVGGAFSKGFRCFLRFYGSFIGHLG